MTEAELADEEAPPELQALEAEPPADEPQRSAPALRQRGRRLAYYGAVAACLGVLALIAAATAPTLFGYHTYVSGGGASVSAGSADEAVYTVPFAGYIIDTGGAWLGLLLLTAVPLCLLALGYSAVVRGWVTRRRYADGDDEDESAAWNRLQARKAQLRLVAKPEPLTAEELPTFIVAQLRQRRRVEVRPSGRPELDDLRAA